MNKFGLSLGGGGTKGAYHMGVWNALCDMGIEICAVCGTSIGAVNAAAIAQGDAKNALKLWKNIALDDVVKTDEIKNPCNNLFDSKNIMPILSCIYKNSGLETEPLRNVLKDIINEEKLRESSVSYGLVTYSLEKMSEEELFLEDIPEGQLIDYIMASASLPGLKQAVIDNKKYIDGGVADNIPANMLIKRGIRDIITVDTGGVGIVKDVPATGINHIKIKCSDNIIGHMEFDSESILKMIKLGYFDCLKAFGRTCGDVYSFNISDYHRALLKYSKDIVFGLEKAAEIYGIDKLKLYSIEALIDGVKRAYRQSKHSIEEHGMDLLKFDDKQILTKLIDNFVSDKSEGGVMKFFGGIIKDIACAANAAAYFIM